VLLGVLLFIGGGILLGIGQHRILTRDSHAKGPTDPMERALWLMSNNILIDGHNDLAWQVRWG
jgi:hypothetical protein